MTIDKKNLREMYKTLRFQNNLLGEIYSQQIAKNLEPYLKEANSFGIFVSFGDEINTKYIIDKYYDSKKIAIPKVMGKTMVFTEFKGYDSLTRSAFGILESQQDEVVDVNTLDVMIVPMLAFNDHGYRLGYGGGYYDHILKDYKGRIVGVAFDYQKSEHHFEENYDIPCDVIVTNREVMVFN